MARLGKIEKYILIHCYKKTISKVMPECWKFPRYWKNANSEFGYKYLFKSEILLNYFDLSLSRKDAFLDVNEKFRDTPEYRKALATLTRTFKTLGIKEYIIWWKGVNLPSWQGITLTEKGIDKAKELLNVNSEQI